MRRLLPLVMLALAGLALAACGSSSAGSGTTDPASAAPADSLVYGSVVVRPKGDLKSSVDAAARKLTDGQDAGRQIQRALDKGLASEDLSYAKDIKPWLGEHAGFFVTSISGSSASGAALIDSKNDDKAKSAIAKAVEKSGDKTRKRSYKGTDYQFDAKDDSAYAVTDGLVIAGTEQGVKDALAAKDGDGLDDAPAFERATDKVTDDGLALFYVDAPKLLDAAANANPQTAAAVQALRNSPQVKNLRPTAAAMTVTKDSVALEAPATRRLDAPRPVADLPADSWLALSIGGFGDNLRSSLKSLNATGQGNMLGLLESQLRSQTGLSLQGDLLSWLGDFSGFISGGTPSTFAAGAFLGSKNPSASRRAVAHIGRVLRARSKLPITPKANGFALRTKQADVAIQSKGDHVIAAVGRNAVAKTQSPSSKLGTDPTFRSALTALGEGAKPGFYLAVPTLVNFAALSASGSSSDFQQAEPYLRHITFLTYGTADGDGGPVGRLVLGLK
jgi:uncharacterized protein DUF3352